MQTEDNYRIVNNLFKRKVLTKENKVIKLSEKERKASQKAIVIIFLFFLISEGNRYYKRGKNIHKLKYLSSLKEHNLFLLTNYRHQYNDYYSGNNNSHFHVLPPHLFTYAVCTTAKALCRYGQVFYLIKREKKCHKFIRKLLGPNLFKLTGLIM
jgi:hypothetical protein